jgi:hypothetical protein
MKEAEEFAQRLTSELCKNAAKKTRDKKICDNIGVAPQTLKNYKYQNRCMPLASFLKLLIEYKEYETLNLLAERLNCIIYKLPDSSNLPNIDLLKKTNEVMYDAAKTVDSVVKSMEDGQYDEKEKQDTKKIIKETLEALIALDVTIDNF